MTQVVVELVVQKLVPEVSYRKVPDEYLDLVKAYDSSNCGCAHKRESFVMLHAQLAPLVKSWEIVPVSQDYKVYKMTLSADT